LGKAILQVGIAVLSGTVEIGQRGLSSWKQMAHKPIIAYGTQCSLTDRTWVRRNFPKVSHYPSSRTKVCNDCPGCDKSCWQTPRCHRETNHLGSNCDCVATGMTMPGRFYRSPLQLCGQRIHVLAASFCTLVHLRQQRCSSQAVVNV